MAGLTVKETPLKGAGGYTTTTPTKKGGAGTLKPMGGGVANRSSVTKAKSSPYYRGRSGMNADTVALLRNTPRTVLP